MGMPESIPVNPAESGLEARTYFVRNRNALVARASFSELFVDYYLHLSDHKIRLQPEHDTMFSALWWGSPFTCRRVLGTRWSPGRCIFRSRW